MVSSVEIAKPESTHETNPLKDAGIVSDIRDLYISKSALDATLSTIGIAADLVDMAVNPIKTAVSWAVNWIISHIDPLPDMLQQFTGDPEKVEAAALTWERIGDQWTQAAAELEAAVAAGLDAQVCRTLSAYKVQIGSVIEAFRSLGDACKVVAQCLWGCAQVVDGLFMRLLSSPLGVVRIRWGICRPGWCGCDGGCRSLRSRWRPRCIPGRGW